MQSAYVYKQHTDILQHALHHTQKEGGGKSQVEWTADEKAPPTAEQCSLAEGDTKLLGATALTISQEENVFHVRIARNFATAVISWYIIIRMQTHRLLDFIRELLS